MAIKDRATIIYPVLGSSADLWFLRIAGHGLGNCFYTYFHAVALAQMHGACIVTPPWFSLKIGPLLRRERSKRLYWRMFKPYEGEIHGMRKLFTLLRSYRERVVLKVGEPTDPLVVKGALNFVVSSRFTFRGLHPHRAVIRERILGTVNDTIPLNHRWGDGGYIAVHVRLGDFAEVANESVVIGDKPNLRIPLTWYVNVMRVLRRQLGNMPVHVFSDGDRHNLKPIIDEGATLYQTGSDMTDLLAMAGASVLVGSNSTYSRWAAFLGNMPSIWLQTAVVVEKPSAADTPIAYVPLGQTEAVLWS